MGQGAALYPRPGVTDADAEVDGERAVVETADDGPSVTPDRLPTRFESLVKGATAAGASASRSRLTGTRHGGTIAAGPCVTIALPLGEPFPDVG